MDLQNHIEKYKDLKRGNMPEVAVSNDISLNESVNSAIGFEIETNENVMNQIRHQSSSEIRRRSNQNSLLKDFPQKQGTSWLNPFGNHSKGCQCCFRLFAFVVVLVVLLVIVSIIFYN
jgi:hypothetical protein